MASRIRLLAPLMLLGLALLSGCAQVSVREYVKMTSQLSFDDTDKIAQASDARSVFALLKDASHFPDESYSDIFVRDKSLELVGPLSNLDSSVDSSVLAAREDAIARSIPGANAGGAAVTRTAASSGQGVIWFEKISAIEVSRLTLFLRQAQGYTKDMNGYICFLRMTDGSRRYFRSPNAGDTKRLAAAFSFYSGAPVSSPSIYPQAGARISPRDGTLVAVQIDGPFDAAGIPVGAKLLAIDGVASQDPAFLVKSLGDLATGKHQVQYQEFLTLSVVNKEIDLGN